MQEVDFNPGWAFWLIVVPIIVLVEIVFFVGVTVPFINVLTRLRANYLPRAVSLDHVMEAGREEEPRQKSWIKSIIAWRYYENPKIGPNVRTFLPMAKRVYQIEGVRGLYKGTFLSILQLLVMFVLIFLFLEPSKADPSEFKIVSVDRPLSSLCKLTISVLVLLPTEVLIRRTMVHHSMVSWRNPRIALRQVLSPTELLQPWRLYTVPGLLPLQLFRQFTASYVTHFVRYWTLPVMEVSVPLTGAKPNQDEFHAPTSDTFRITFFGLIFFLAWSLGAALVLVPIDCILVRLMTQYDRTSTLDISSHQGQAAFEQDLEDEIITTANEPVTSLRPCYGHDQPTSTEFGASQVEPYKSASDCFYKMYEEEGSESLMRGAFYTISGYMLLAFS